MVLVAFQMLDLDGDGHLRISDLIRLYVGMPKLCTFSDELRVIFGYYL